MKRSVAVVSIAAIVGIAIAARLGFWQLDRAAQKVAAQRTLDERAALPPVDAASLARTPGAEADAQLQRRVVVEGEWLGDRTVYLDNRQMDDRVGFFVVTPLRLAGRGDVVLVQRGFAPRSFVDRVALPRVSTPAGPVRVAGRIAAQPARLYQLGAEAGGPIRQNLDAGAYARETGLALLPATIVQADGVEGGVAHQAADGLSRHWPRPVADVQKHYGYAFQWFMIAAAIACLHVWFRIVAPRRRARASAAAASGV